MSAGCENADPTPRSPTYISDSKVVDLDPLAVRSPEEGVDRPTAAFSGRRLEVAVYGKPLSYRLDRTFRILMESDSGTEEIAATLYDLPSGLLLRRANVSIAQLHPLAIRTMVAWTWVCLFKGWELSVDVFRSLHYLKMGTGPSEGYWSLYTESGYCTSYPKLTSVKGCRERWLFVRSSTPFDHPRHFRNDVHARFEAVEEWCPGKVQPVTDIYLSPDQTEVREYFRARHNKKSEALPGIWLPPVDVITEDLHLSRVGLLPARPRDTYSSGWSKEELARIGLNADNTPVTNTPDVPSPSVKISLCMKIMELKKLGPGEAKVRMPLHRSEEPAGLRTGPLGSHSTKRLKIILSDKVTVAPSCPLSQGAEEDPLEVVTTRASGAVSTASTGAVTVRSPGIAPIISTEAVTVGAPRVAPVPSTGAAAARAPSVASILSTGAASVRAPSVAPISSTGAPAVRAPSVAHIPSTGAATVRASGVAHIPSTGTTTVMAPSVAPVIPTRVPNRLPSLASLRAQSAAIGRIARSVFEDMKSFGHGDAICALNRAQELCGEAKVKFPGELAEVKGELVDVLSKFDTQKDELRAANDKCELVGAEWDKLREELGILRGELEASRASEAAVRAELESARVFEAAAKTAYAGLKGTLDQVNALRVEAYNKGYVQGDLDTKEVVAELYPNFDFEALLLLEEMRDKRRATRSLK
ncbi:hypothetical protein RND81_09G141200 [Saponaria officinalis]|uniref:Uncharacterized protein n=1 Tax=Saponaria officinalis TaxID=3572 RepID=A0AAW1IKJ8_SAPOF